MPHPMAFRYLRLKMDEVDSSIIPSSIRRMAAIRKYQPIDCLRSVIDALSDQTDDEFRVYQEIGPDDHIKTIATGTSSAYPTCFYLHNFSFSLSLFFIFRSSNSFRFRFITRR